MRSKKRKLDQIEVQSEHKSTKSGINSNHAGFNQKRVLLSENPLMLQSVSSKENIATKEQISTEERKAAHAKPQMFRLKRQLPLKVTFD